MKLIILNWTIVLYYYEVKTTIEEILMNLNEVIAWDKQHWQSLKWYVGNLTQQSSNYILNEDIW